MSTSVDEFFGQEQQPNGFQEKEKAIAAFLSFHRPFDRRIVCVTSGGTTVPLERNTVRFIDNFSEGSRGAAAVEHFLEKGYAVLLIRRAGSIAPFARHLQQALGCRYLDTNFISHLSVDPSTHQITLNPPAAATASRSSDDVKSHPSSSSSAAPPSLDHLAHILSRHRQVVDRQLLLSLEFTTIHEYMFLLRAVAIALEGTGPRGCLFLAAAVSDFYVPSSHMVTHKIQSVAGPLVLQLPQTPKLLSELKPRWCPRVFCVSFKLETDIAILLSKAENAIHKYNMDAVVANELHSRKHKVVVVTPSSKIEVIDAAFVQTSSSSSSSLPATSVAASASSSSSSPAPVFERVIARRELDGALIDIISELHAKHIERTNSGATPVSGTGRLASMGGGKDT